MTRLGWTGCILAYWLWRITPLWTCPAWYSRARDWLLSWAGVYAHSKSLADFNDRHARFGEGRCQAPD